MEQLFAGRRESLLSPGSCYLADALNRTEALPDEVNRLDLLVETRMRDHAVALLNRVSQEGIQPSQALIELQQALIACMKGLEEQLRERIGLMHRFQEYQQQAIAIQQKIRACTTDAEFLALTKEYIGTLTAMRELTETIEGQKIKGWTDGKNTPVFTPWEPVWSVLSSAQTASIQPGVQEAASAVPVAKLRTQVLANLPDTPIDTAPAVQRQNNALTFLKREQLGTSKVSAQRLQPKEALETLQERILTDPSMERART